MEAYALYAEQAEAVDLKTKFECVVKCDASGVVRNFLFARLNPLVLSSADRSGRTTAGSRMPGLRT